MHRTPATAFATPSGLSVAGSKASRAIGAVASICIVLVLTANVVGVRQGEPRQHLTEKATNAPPPLCVQPVSRLTVQRHNSFPQNHIRFNFPAHLVVTGAARVERAAHAICNLPIDKSHGKALSCPADLGVWYALRFSGSPKAIPVVKILPAGCEDVVGVRPGQTASRTPSFWTVLGRVLGLRSPTRETFGGTLPPQ